MTSPAFTCEFFSVTDGELAKYELAYPGVPLLVEFAKIECWLRADSRREKKSVRGYRKFVNGWLARVHGRLLEAQVGAEARESRKREQQRMDAMIGLWEGYRK